MLGHCYADNTQLYFYCHPDQMRHLADVFSRYVKELRNWMHANCLKLNKVSMDCILESTESASEIIANYW